MLLTDHGLMRLLVDLPADRKAKLAQAWQVSGTGETAPTVAIYRRILAEGVLADTLDRLGEAERLIFRRLASSNRNSSQNDLLRSLPFAEDRIATALTALEGLGLIWPGPASGRGSGQRVWFVPRDLARTFGRDRRSVVPASKKASAQPQGPELRLLRQSIVPNVPSDVVAGVIDRLSNQTGDRDVPAAKGEPSIRTIARRLGVGLGVWDEDAPELRPGSRYARWQEATDSERRRAVARLWLVEGGARQLEGPLRRAAWDTIRDAVPEQWYDFNSVALVLAAKLGSLEAGEERPPSVKQAESARGLSRSSVERVLVDLTWLGVLEAAMNPVGRLLAVRVTLPGRVAIEESWPLENKAGAQSGED